MPSTTDKTASPKKSGKFIFSQDYDLFAFGDSLSDIGRIFSITQGTFPPSPPYFDGRYSNGPVAVETLAKQLGANHSQTTNFAIGGARTDRTNNEDTETLKLGGLLTQIDEFSAQADALGADSNDLYFIWAGANNFLGLAEAPDIDPVPVLGQAVADIITAVSTLISTGAKNIVVTLSPNLGRVPLSLQAGPAFSENVTALTQAFNTQLVGQLTALDASLAGVNIILPDLFATSELIAEDPSAFGFVNVEAPYLFTPNPPANPNSFFFWDIVHPTNASHGFFANTMYDSVINTITEDVTLVGTAKDDKLVGFAGGDRLKGRSGDDELLGNSGDDYLLAGRGNDLLDGGAGDDKYRGGSGADVFVLALGAGVDTIYDFRPWQGDKIALQGSLTFEDLAIERSGRKGVQLSVEGETLAIVKFTQLDSINPETVLTEI